MTTNIRFKKSGLIWIAIAIYLNVDIEICNMITQNSKELNFTLIFHTGHNFFTLI